jgi:hypothetical protein
MTAPPRSLCSQTGRPLTCADVQFLTEDWSGLEGALETDLLLVSLVDAMRRLVRIFPLVCSCYYFSSPGIVGHNGCVSIVATACLGS